MRKRTGNRSQRQPLKPQDKPKIPTEPCGKEVFRPNQTDFQEEKDLHEVPTNYEEEHKSLDFTERTEVQKRGQCRAFFYAASKTNLTSSFLSG